MIGNGVYIDAGVRVGDRVNIHNKALLYRNLRVENDAFIGPGVCFVNDPRPRANRVRNLKGRQWTLGKGASVGANATVLSDISIGRYAMVGAGSVVSCTVPAYGLVYGVPARLKGFVDERGRKHQAQPLSPRKPPCGGLAAGSSSRASSKKTEALPPGTRPTPASTRSCTPRSPGTRSAPISFSTPSGATRRPSGRRTGRPRGSYAAPQHPRAA